MINQQILVKLKEIVTSCLKEHNLELVEINYRGRGRSRLSVLIDKPEGGINIDECALMNNVISQALDSANILSNGYILEVSSPGIDRPLKDKHDFLRVLNKRVRCLLKEPFEKKKEVEGFVKKIDEEAVSLDTDEGFIEVFFNNIAKANQIIN